MQSSFRVIKNSSVVDNGTKEINTNYVPVNIIEKSDVLYLDEHKKEAETLIENARKQSEAILEKARQDSERIKKEVYDSAYQAGFEKGYNEGKEKGYQDGYEQTIVKASAEADKIIKSAKKILFNSKIEYENYLEEKKDEIVNLAITIGETVLKTKIQEKEGLEALVFEALSDSRNAETFILSCNEAQAVHIKDNIKQWKERLAFKGEIFVIEDNRIELGNAVIEKNNGSIVVGMDIGMNNIKQALMDMNL